MIAGTCGPGDGNLAVGVKELVAAGRAHEDRRIVSGAEQLDTDVDLGHIAHRQQPLPHGFRVVLELGQAQRVAGNHVEGGEHIPVFVVEHGADHALGQILLDVGTLLAGLIPDLRHAPSGHILLEHGLQDRHTGAGIGLYIVEERQFLQAFLDPVGDL